MDRFDDDTLLAELRELRPTPRPEFTAELDERAAAGFPRRDSRASRKRFARLRGISSRGGLVPVVGFAIVVLTVATVVVAVSSSGGGHPSSIASSLHVEHGVSSSGAVEEGGGAGAESAEASGHKATHNREIPQFEVESTESFTVPNKAKSAAPKETAKPEEAEGAAHGGEEAIEGEVEAAPLNGFSAAGKAKAPSTARGHRDVERSSTIVLGTKPDQVAGAAAKVYAAVHAAGGIVLSSSVESGSTGSTGASFSLLIPSGKVDDALAEFSKIAEVRSRHDATDDITAPTVGVTEELRDSNASIEGLLKELGSAETESERESVEARLREERRHHAAIRASLEHLHKRASMSEVSLRIVTGHGAGAVPVGKGKSGGDWSVGDALHDAGHILTIIAGVLLIALAILAPIALIALLLWSLNRFRVRRLRERALG
jgi:Domain of unknown function (DUF4349)